MYVIVVGAGQIGSQVLDLATTTENEVVVVERDPEVAEAASREYDCLVLNGDATNREILEDAGADRADAIICTTDEDATNLMVLFLAKELDIASLVTVVQDPDHLGIFERVGATILENPQRLIAQYLFRAVQRPAVEDFMELGGDAEIFETTVAPDAPIAGLSLRDAGESGLLGDDVLLVAIERTTDGTEEVITPRGGTTVEPGDVVTVFSRVGMTDDVLETFAGL
ncbi:potassium channel family protein [Halocalculus aciditolerans]|uniref:Potassium transporter Trk n=1 Tax=Halocalculus aciditolerans TaxID=1383812 RepID=A0A830F389_9EURY|nr:TrkA family potassium uptake protein [Halocalculus aciditolerans]GGL50829.1 potassium transporter Trk [Halocalculus aciditolerans]